MTEVGLGFNVSCSRLIGRQLTSYLLFIQTHFFPNLYLYNLISLSDDTFPPKFIPQLVQFNMARLSQISAQMTSYMNVCFALDNIQATPPLGCGKISLG